MHTKKINYVFKKLFLDYPKPQTELKFINNFTFLVAVILSAQATDLSVNKATKNLFETRISTCGRRIRETVKHLTPYAE